MTGLTGVIRPRVPGCGTFADRRSELLSSAWLISDAGYKPPGTSTAWGAATGSDVPAADVGPVLVVLSDDVPEVVTIVRATIRAKRRVYVLAPEGWAASKAPDWLDQTPPTSVLIRRVRGLPAAMVLSGRSGWLWAGGSGPGAWCLELDALQADAARLAFLSMFWLDADDEGWPAKGGIQWRPRGEAPFDIAGPAAAAPVVLVRGHEELKSVADDALVCIASGKVPAAGSPRRLWVPPSGADHGALSRIVRSGAQVVWANADLPTCATGRAPVLLASSERLTLRIALNARQAADVAAVLSTPTPASFHVDVPLGAAEEALRASGTVWLAGAASAQTLVPEQVIDVGTVKAGSLRDVAQAAPPTLPPATPLALAVRWTWEVDVPRTPPGAAEDPLVRRWRAVDEAAVARLQGVAQRLSAVEQREGALARMFEALKGALLGFGRSRSDLRSQIAELEVQVPSRLGPATARDVLSRLADLEAGITKLESELDVAEQKERDDQERRRQESVHEVACATAAANAKAKEAALTSKRERLARVEEQLAEAGVADPAIPPKDRIAKERSLGDEKRLLAHQIRDLERAIEHERRAAVHPFEFKPPARVRPGKGRATFVPPSAEPGGPAVPSEALPSVGRLRVAGKERILAIGTWEELDVGEAEAHRLGARLVADVGTA